MNSVFTIGVISDIHYASAAEQERGNDYEIRAVGNPLLRLALRFYRHFIWLRQPLRQNHLLDKCIEAMGPVDLVVANGDYSCDSAFVGLSDNAACASAAECLGRLRARFGERFYAILGDHELGKLSLAGQCGGMRLASYRRAVDELRLRPFWTFDCGRYVLMGVVSSLIALPLFAGDILPAERAEWESLRAAHISEIRNAFDRLRPEQRLILFCHDPSALPFLWKEEAVRGKLGQVDLTVIGHLHSRLIYWKSGQLAGMPVIRFAGGSIQRMSSALSEARHWRPFKVKLCPSPAGIELLKDGGFLTVRLKHETNTKMEIPPEVRLHRLRRGM